MKATLGVRELVLEGEVAPGDRVPEVALAEPLGVSRTPLPLARTPIAHERAARALRGRRLRRPVVHPGRHRRRDRARSVLEGLPSVSMRISPPLVEMSRGSRS
jgi:DNA-binding GntR family transcriptional regulator